MDVPSQSEREAIRVYKNADAELPDFETIKDLYAPDFDPEAYPDLDKVDALHHYIQELTTYCSYLNTAARLRQAHYETFILPNGADTEDRGRKKKGHKVWRENMNAIANDCNDKLRYWSQMSDKEFRKLVRRQEILNKNIDYSVHKVDIEPVSRKVKKNVASRPKMSLREKEQLQLEYERQAALKKKEEEELIESAIAENEPHMQVSTDLLARKVQAANVVNVSIREYFDKFRKMRFVVSEDDRGEVIVANEGDVTSTIVSTRGSIRDFAEFFLIIHDKILAYHRIACEACGCQLSNNLSTIDLQDTSIPGGVKVNVCLEKSVHKCGIIGKAIELDKTPPGLQTIVSMFLDNLEWIIRYNDGAAKFFLVNLSPLFIYDSRLSSISGVGVEVFQYQLTKYTDDYFIDVYRWATNLLQTHKVNVKRISELDMDKETKSKNISMQIQAITNITRFLEILQYYPEYIYRGKIILIRKLLDRSDKDILAFHRSLEDELRIPRINYKLLRDDLRYSFVANDLTVKEYQDFLVAYKKRLKKLKSRK